MSDSYKVYASKDEVLPITGGRLTGSLNVGSVYSRDSVLLTQHRQGSDEETKLQLQLQIDDQDTGNLAFFKDGVLVNRMRLFEDKTIFSKPIDISGGGHGGTTADEARENLGITPENIGALSTTGGTMLGNINMGTINESNSRIIGFGRLMSDGTTKAQAQIYLTGGGSHRTDLYQGGAIVNYMTLANDHVKFGKPLTISCDGAIQITAAGTSSTVKHTLFSDKNLPTAEQISGLDTYTNELINIKLPDVTTDDNGKVLQVVDGVYELVLNAPSASDIQRGVLAVEYGGTGQSSIVDTTYTTARYRASALVNSDTTPSDNGVIYWMYE